MLKLKRMISLLLALVMVFGMLPPVAVYAEETETVAQETTAPAESMEFAENTEEETFAPVESATEATQSAVDPTAETMPEETIAAVDQTEPKASFESNEGSFLSDNIIASGICGDNLTWTLDGEGNLRIEGTGEMYHWDIDVDIGSGVETVIYHPWLYISDTKIQSVYIGDGVTTIGNHAFGTFDQLREIRIPDSVTRIGYFSFSSCKSLEHIELPDGLDSILLGSFYGCSKLKDIVIPANITVIEEHCFENCESLSEIYFMGDAPIFGLVTEEVFSGVTATAYYPSNNETWYADGYTLGIDPKRNYGGNITWVPYTPGEEPELKIGYHDDVNYFSEMTANDDLAVHLDYEDSFFKDSSYTYNHDLAKASLKLAMSAFVSHKKREGGINGDAKNAYDYLKKIHCDESAIIDYGYNQEPTTDSIACIIGSKQLANQDETLVIVAIRGQGYDTEWGGNFRVGPSLVYHQGFETAAEKVLRYLNDYIDSQKNVSGNIKLWITGYSRAAATANILGGKLVNGQAKLVNKATLTPEDLYVYTFETPAGVKITGNPRSEKYHNIFNIINSADFVTKVAPNVWGFGRFGIDCFLPDLSSSGNTAVYTKYKELTDTTYVKPFEGTWRHARQSIFLDLAMDKLAVTAGGEAGYVLMDQATLINSCKINKKLPSFDVLFNGALVHLALSNADTIAVILEKSDQIMFGHYPENCLAMMETLTDESGYTDGKYKYYIVKCPVDISVTDDRGYVIAAIENDAVSRLGNENVDVYVDENGDKYVFILDDTNYELQLMATDDGEMDCTVVSYQQGQGKTSQSAFFDVPLVEGESYTAPFSMEDDHYVLYSKEGILIPDVVVNGDELYNVAVHVETVGNGAVTGAAECYTIGDTVNLMAVPEEGSIFGGWYADGDLVSPDEEYVFGIQGDCTLTAIFLSNEMTVTLDQEYVALQIGETVQLTAKAQPAELTELIQWHMENDDETVASVDENGLVTAKAAGTTYVIASVTDGETTLTARCRVDVVEPEMNEETNTPEIQVDGIQLNTTKVTSELYSTDYAEFDLLLELPQNVSFMSTDDREIPESNSVAIEEAWFTASTAKVAFDLIPLDDRRIAIVPTDYAVDYPEELLKSYKSQVTVVVDGEEYTTEEVLTLTLKQSKPKIKATIPAFNSFYTGQTQTITFTGGTVTSVSDKDIPEWLNLNSDFTLSLNENAGTKNSGKAVLLADTEGWIIPVEVSLSVKNAYKAPDLKLSETSVKMTANAADSSGIALTLMPKSKTDTLSGLHVKDITVADEFEYSIEKFNAETGTFTLKAENGFRPGTVVLNVSFSDTGEVLPLNLKVAVQNVSLKLSPASVTLNRNTGDMAQIHVTAAPADYRLTALDIGGNDGFFETTYENGILTVVPTAAAEAGKTYSLTVSAGGSKAVTLKIKVTEDTPTVTLKAKGNIDLSFLKQTVTVTPAFKNHASGEIADYTATVTAPDGSTSDAFEVRYENGAFLVTCKDTEIVTGTYRLYLSMKVNDDVTLETDAKLNVKRTAVKLKLDPSKLTLNKAVNDLASVAVTCTTKGYDFSEEPIWELLAKNKKDSAEGRLDIAWNNGQLDIAVNDSTEPGAVYNLQVKANAYAPAVNLGIKIVDTKPTVSLKASGTIDVIREGTSIIVTPGYKNCMDADKTETLNVYSSADDYAEPVNELFQIEKDEMGRYVLAAASGLDHTKSYKVELESVVSGIAVTSAKTSVKVKMGSAKLTLSADGNTIFGNDSKDRIGFRITAQDETLKGVKEILSKDERFEVVPYGNGEFALAFKDETVDRTLPGKTVTVSLNVFLEGNETTETAKPKSNATLKLKVSIVK